MNGGITSLAGGCDVLLVMAVGGDVVHDGPIRVGAISGGRTVHDMWQFELKAKSQSTQNDNCGSRPPSEVLVGTRPIDELNKSELVGSCGEKHLLKRSVALRGLT